MSPVEHDISKVGAFWDSLPLLKVANIKQLNDHLFTMTPNTTLLAAGDLCPQRPPKSLIFPLTMLVCTIDDVFDWVDASIIQKVSRLQL